MFTGKKVLIIGLAKSGKAALNLLKHLNATITVNEYAPKEKIAEYDEYKEAGIEMITGGHPDELFERDFDFVVRNPGINYKKPFLLRLKERGIPVYTEIELAYQVSAMQNYIAITGTNGKTTTVTLVHEIFKNALRPCALAGNVGIPLCEEVLNHDLIHHEGYDIVLEMSNFQLLDIKELKPHIAVIMNLTPDHLDYMSSLDEYYASKTRIYMNQDEHDYCLVNLDDETVLSYLKQYPFKSQPVTFSLEKEADCMIKDGAIIYKGEHIINLDEIKIVGRHNISNMMIAICCAMLSNVDKDIIYKTLSSFMGVEHRIEYVRELNGVKYYNDSKGTNTDAAIIALKAFDKPVILLMGGYEKGLDLAEMASYKDKISTLITFGDAKERFARDMNVEKTYIVDHMKDAILKAHEIARDGDVVLLSPSTSSFDEFKSYEHRGKVFKDIVNEL